MPLPKSASDTFPDGTVAALETHDDDWWIYHSIGATVRISGHWFSYPDALQWLLGSGYDSAYAHQISLNNEYHLRGSGLYGTAVPQVYATNVSSLDLSEWAIGFGIDLESEHPGSLYQLLPIVGVVAEATITVSGQIITLSAATGDV